MNTSTDTLKTGTPKTSGGSDIGQSATDLVGFYGATPIVQPTAAAQALVVDSSGGAAAPTNGIAAFTAGFNSATTANAIATLAAQTNAIQAALVALGLMKGS